MSAALPASSRLARLRRSTFRKSACAVPLADAARASASREGVEKALSLRARLGTAWHEPPGHVLPPHVLLASYSGPPTGWLLSTSVKPLWAAFGASSGQISAHGHLLRGFRRPRGQQKMQEPAVSPAENRGARPLKARLRRRTWASLASAKPMRELKAAL